MSEAVWAGEITVRNGRPVCSSCGELMVHTGLQKPTKETPLFKCPGCGNEFPPAEARQFLRSGTSGQSQTGGSAAARGFFARLFGR
jgi:hypothetical protein